MDQPTITTYSRLTDEELDIIAHLVSVTKDKTITEAHRKSIFDKCLREQTRRQEA